MRKTTYLLLLLFGLFSINTVLKLLAHEKRKTDYSEVQLSEINKKEVEYVSVFTDSIINVLEKGGYYYSPKFFEYNKALKKVDHNFQKRFHKIIRSKYGNYKSLEFISMLRSKTGNVYQNKIYRFTGIYDSGDHIEIRAIFNDQNKLRMIGVLPWKNEL